MNRLQYINLLKANFPKGKSIWSPTAKRFIVTGLASDMTEDKRKLECDLCMSYCIENYETGIVTVGYVTSLQRRVEDAINNNDCTC
jgi:hypothetical protein